MNKRKIIISGVIILGVVISTIGITKSNSFQIASKKGKADKIMKQHKDGTLETLVAIKELEEIKDKADIEEIKTYVQELRTNLSKYHNGQVILQEAKDAISNNTIKENGYMETSKYWHIDRISKAIKSDSELYQESLDVIAQLTGYSQKELNITYSKEKTTAGLQKVRIKVENNIGKDIKYIKLDFFEKSKDGKILNSDWTNSDKIIKNKSIAYIETYYDFIGSDTTLEFEIADINYR